MDDLTLAPTTSSPQVRLDGATGLLVVRGESYPENSFEFYTPILQWVEAFLESSTAPVRLELGLTYLNTSSIKSMMDLLDLFEEAHKAGREVSVTWFYDEENDRAMEMGEEFKEEVTLPFFIVPEKA